MATIDMRSKPYTLSRWWVAIAASAVFLAICSWLLPPEDVETHNVLHHLNFLPLMAAGMVYGWRGAVWATLFSTLVNLPHWVLFLQRARADIIDQMIEMAIFGMAGMIAGFLADRERAQKAKVEATKEELERVHQALQANIEQVKKSERLSAAGQLAASLAHEIRNPLASISGAAGILGRGNTSGRNMTECLDIIQKESGRLNQLLSHFLEFARPRPPKFQSTDLRALVQSVVTQAEHLKGATSVPVRPSLNAGLPEVECDPEQIRQVLINLVLNAIQASTGDQVVEVETRLDGQRVAVAVKDRGIGMSNVDQARIFEPFFTTKANGTGLGLAIASKIIEQHQGTLTAEETAGGGTTFRFELPVRRTVHT